MARANSIDDRHRYGQHYTPPNVAQLLAAFAVQSPEDLVLDPSCGDGRLLQAAMDAKNWLRASRSWKQRSNDSRQDACCPRSSLFGVERSTSAARVARRTGASIAVSDFFDIQPHAEPGGFPNRPFDGIIGNPPYIRHEIVGSKHKLKIQDALLGDRLGAPDVIWPQWSGRSDIYVYFFAHSIRFLRPGGRLVFITASSWLDVGYGAALREFLVNNFRVITIIESGCESFFENASINTAITVLEREPDPKARAGNSIRFVRFNRKLSEILAENRQPDSQPIDAAFRLASRIARGTASAGDAYRLRLVDQPVSSDISSKNLILKKGRLPRAAQQGCAKEGWGKYLHADDVFFKVISRGSSRLRSLSNMASVRFGVKTGANEFFYVTQNGQPANDRRKGGKQATADNRLLALKDVARVRRGITTGANEFFYVSRAREQAGNDGIKQGRRPANGSHGNGSGDRFTLVRDAAGITRRIETRLLSPVVFSLKEIPGVLLEQVESQRLLFNCSLAADQLSGSEAREYIKSGERSGYDQRPTCAARDPWYAVARDMRPAPLIFPSKIGERWVVALNRARVFEDKKLYGIFPNRGVSELALAALLNSTWARYFAEITCRQMTGAQAIADIDVAVAERIAIPDPRELSPFLIRRLEASISDLSQRAVGSVFEEVTLADRRRLDALTLEAIGFTAKAEREEMLAQLYEAVTRLVRVRLLKARNG